MFVLCREAVKPQQRSCDVTSPTAAASGSSSSAGWCLPLQRNVARKPFISFKREDLVKAGIKRHCEAREVVACPGERLGEWN